MSYSVRPMEVGDIPQVKEIEREAFPTQAPTTSFKRELESSTAAYIVAYENEDYRGEPTSKNQVPAAPARSRFGRLLSEVKDFLSGEPLSPEVAATNERILGFAGLWFVAGEAHLTSIAVGESHRREGVGEQLLISAINAALERNAEFVTLEVRVTNSAAQPLYEKYGFHKVGVRRGYYTDNKEDALLMSTDKINTASYQANFQRLKRAHAEKGGNGENSTAATPQSL
ncbi:MAG: ribosomal-protein-alanine N-acetyltransferase [Chloroflexi bacterium RBG_13_54_9]|nr:MAG: ribosomal-protein-alanine N-acetyltransferase [Chloroflexi bacterium RBG_13_54_9]